MRQPDRFLSGCSYFVAAIFGAAIILIVLDASHLRPSIRNDVSNADFLAVILSALGVMIAILTFFLGVLAIFGWTAFRTIIDDKFEDLVRRRFDANNPQYGQMVSRLVDDARAQLQAEKPPIDDLPENDPELDQDLD